MTTRLIAVRHGNTFESGETPRRVGARTDLPLTEHGRRQAAAAGTYLRESGFLPSAAYTSPLLRTRETAEIALRESNPACPLEPAEFLREIDYGPDENQTEETVIARIGRKAIDDWNISAVVPEGWRVEPDKITAGWRHFTGKIIRDHAGGTVLAVTSNGIARFLPHILEAGAFDNFRARHTLKVSTGGLCIFEHDGMRWSLREWNLKPELE